MEKAVSVIIPVYNRADLIERCIKSVTEQSLSDIEIIVVDDGSTDSTLSVVRSIDDDRIKIITQENAGQGFARNAGLLAASGRYITFVDSDDTIERDMLKVMHERAEKENADIVQCNISDVYPDGHKTVQLKGIDKTVTIADCGKYCDKYFTPCRHSFEVCNKLIKRKVLTKSGVMFRDTRKYFSEDLLFNLELLSRIKKVSFIKEPYYNYYQNGSSHFHSDNTQRVNSCFELFADFIKSADEPLKSAAKYTAAVVILYSSGFCENVRELLKNPQLNEYIKTALWRSCTLKHRLFLTAMCVTPLSVRERIVKMFSGRWEK